MQLDLVVHSARAINEQGRLTRNHQSLRTVTAMLCVG
jgi:hypothetical protein